MTHRARNLHRLVGASLGLRTEPVTGECHLCRRGGLERPATHWLFNWANQRFALCEAHARRGRELGYDVVEPTEAAPPP